MQEKILARLAELDEAERETITRLTVIRTLRAELQALIAPEPVVTTGEEES